MPKAYSITICLYISRCVGTVMQYCNSNKEHQIVFDEILVQPQWVVITCDNIDVLLGPDEIDHTGI